MARITLKNLIGPRREADAIVAAIASAFVPQLAIEDSEGRLLHGEVPPAGAVRVPITFDGANAGWVNGGVPAQAVAALLAHLLSKESERKELGAEVLHLYREVNLIYSFSEKLAALLDLDRVTQLTLEQARHLIPASDGVLMLLDEASGTLSTIAGFGDTLPHMRRLARGEGVIGAIASSGVAEIVDDVDADSRRVTDGNGVRALLCAPLRVGDRVIGVIALGSGTPGSYTAAELKLLNTLALQTATAIENARLFERTIQAAREREALLAANKEMEVARAGFERELELAARIQADLFPPSMPALAGYDLAARNRPARRCGGDYYDALSTGDVVDGSRVLLCVADVSGKGMPAALLMSHMQATLRALLGRCRSLPALATQASDLLFASSAANKYVTAAFLDFDLTSGTGRYVSAGHVDSLLLKADGEAVHLCSTGAPLGLLPPGLPYDETLVSLAPGDCVVLYSDGVADARNGSGEEFGDDRLVELLVQSRTLPAAAIVDRLFEAIDQFAAQAPQFDDITILVLRRGNA
jgi:serine phosphatase RsbU (regulator of sigma subunit)